ncbi:MAG: hypothetical protein NTW19_17860 [Planctomycetota bacterium]|nr:hypothetical protein [Planctomycetota bacterium]
MQCNIDAKGKAARLITGLLTFAVGLVLLGLAATGLWTGLAAWGCALALLASGAFMIFEGWSGWCVVRAMGIKTRI